MKNVSLVPLLLLGCLFICSVSRGQASITTIVMPMCNSGADSVGEDDPARLRSFGGIAVDDFGYIYLSDWNSGYLYKFKETDNCMHFLQGSKPIDTLSGFVDVTVQYPHGVTVDAEGNVYVAQYNGHVVRKISGNGISSIVAGSGNLGYMGDYGPATKAKLSPVNKVVKDREGNLYLSDEMNHVIRKVATDGIISTYAGTPMLNGYNGDGGAATSATLNKPYGLAIDEKGSLYIADRGNNVVRMVAKNGIISTYAGNGKAGYAGDNGPATAATLNNPMGLAIDVVGNLYIADEYNHAIRKVANNGLITTVAGSGKKGNTIDGMDVTKAKLNHPRDVAIDAAGNLYFIDFNNNPTQRIHKLGVPVSDKEVSIHVDMMSGALLKVRIEEGKYSVVSILDSESKVVVEQGISLNDFYISVAGLKDGKYTLDFRGQSPRKLIRFAIADGKQ